MNEQNETVNETVNAANETVDETANESEREKLAGIIEALVFVSGDPIPIKRLMDVLERKEEEIREAIDFLAERYVEIGAGLQIMEVAGGFQLRTRPIYSQYVNRYLERKKKISLSGPALETIAIIAYKQPITRAEIEAIRGVGVDGVLKSLLDKRLVKITGVKEVPGKPNLYGTTKHFLEYFGLISLDDLPPIEDIDKTFSGGAAQYQDEEPSEETPSEEQQSQSEPSEAEPEAEGDPDQAE